MRPSQHVTSTRSDRIPASSHAASEFEVARRDVQGSSVVIVRGPLDLAHSLGLSVALDEALASAPRRLVVDLCAAELVDSTGLAVLVRARRCARRSGVQLTLVCDVPITLKVLALTGLERSFDICPTSEVALGRRSAGTVDR